MTLFIKALRVIRSMVGWVLAFLLSWMTLLALLQLTFRWLEIGGLGWADVHLRHLVLWLALLGGALAAAADRHIRIDILEHYLSESHRKLFNRAINLVAGLGTFFLFILALQYIEGERHSGVVLDRVLLGISLPLWWIELAFPIGMLLISLFFIGNTVTGGLDTRENRE